MRCTFFVARGFRHKYTMRYCDLFERISLPHAFEIYDLIEQCVREYQSDGGIAGLREKLSFALRDFLVMKLAPYSPQKRLVFHLWPPDDPQDSASGMFRAPDLERIEGEGGDQQHPATPSKLPPIADDTVEIIVFFSDYFLEAMRRDADKIRHMGHIALHELTHAAQYFRAAKFNPRSRYTAGIKRPRIDGKRVGKRGGYNSQNSPRYLGTDIEIDAMAVGAASDIIHRTRKEPQDKRRAYLIKTIRSLKDMSPTLASYRETFARSLWIGFGGNKPDPRLKRAKDVIWKTFRLKLARHLMDYLNSPTL